MKTEPTFGFRVDGPSVDSSERGSDVRRMKTMRCHHRTAGAQCASAIDPIAVERFGGTPPRPSTPINAVRPVAGCVVQVHEVKTLHQSNQRDVEELRSSAANDNEPQAVRSAPVTAPAAFPQLRLVSPGMAHVVDAP